MLLRHSYALEPHTEMRHQVSALISNKSYTGSFYTVTNAKVDLPKKAASFI
jgi:hypothetical protein